MWISITNIVREPVSLAGGGRRQCGRRAAVIVLQYVFLTFFFENPKNAIFYVFEVAFQKKLKNVMQKFQVSEYIQYYIKIVDSCI